MPLHLRAKARAGNRTPPGLSPSFELRGGSDQRAELRLERLGFEQALETVLEAVMAHTQSPGRVHRVERAASPEHLEGILEVPVGDFKERLDVDGVTKLGIGPDLGEDLRCLLGGPAGRLVVLEPDLGPGQAQVGGAPGDRGVLHPGVVDDAAELRGGRLVDRRRMLVHRGSRLDDSCLALAEELDAAEPLRDDVGAQDAPFLEVLDGDCQQPVGVTVNHVRILRHVVSFESKRTANYAAVSKKEIKSSFRLGCDRYKQNGPLSRADVYYDYVRI